MTRVELDTILRNAGFERTEDVYPPYGEHFRVVYGINYYEVEVYENDKKNHFANEGASIVLEIYFRVEESDIPYKVEVYRVVKCELYIVHVFTGFEERYFAVQVLDKQELEVIAKLEFDNGYIFVGSQKDLKDILPELLKALNPVSIKVY
jgi:hypothetical protein